MLKAIGTKVIVKRADSEKITATGIIIPEAAQEDQYVGDVVSVGRGEFTDHGVLIAPRVKEGDKVLFCKFSGVEFIHEDVLYIALDLRDIHAVLE